MISNLFVSSCMSQGDEGGWDLKKMAEANMRKKAGNSCVASSLWSTPRRSPNNNDTKGKIAELSS